MKAYNSFIIAVVSVGAALFLFQQLSGINAVVYYSTSLFRSAGITSDVAASALVGASNVFGWYFVEGSRRLTIKMVMQKFYIMDAGIFFQAQLLHRL